MPDYKLQNWRVRDDFDYQRGRDPVPIKIVTFYLDEHGPFTERFTLDEFDNQAVVRERIEKLRRNLRAIDG